MKSSRSPSISPVSEAVGAPRGSLAAGEAQVGADHQAISERARALWRERGCPVGRDEEIWLEAERQIGGVGSARNGARR